MVDGVKGVDRAVLIRTSMGASRRSVKKRQVLSQSLAVHPSILSAARARVGVIDRSHSPRLTQVSFNRHFALATPCAHVPGCYAEPSNFKIGIAHPWSWAIGSSTSAAQRSFDYGRLPSESPAFRVEREIGASGKRPTIPEGNGAVARALFGGLRSHGQRVSAKERAM
jgi:hypothetical protein